MERILAELGSWNWVALGLVLLALEIAIPGIFLLWFGLAAIVIGVLTLMFQGAGFWPWEVQIILFLSLALASAYLGRRFFVNAPESDQPLLNQRGAQLIGRTAVLINALEHGFGRVQIDGVQWRVSGADMPIGASVKVTSHTSGGTLCVVAA